MKYVNVRRDDDRILITWKHLHYEFGIIKFGQKECPSIEEATEELKNTIPKFFKAFEDAEIDEIDSLLCKSYDIGYTNGMTAVLMSDEKIILADHVNHGDNICYFSFEYIMPELSEDIFANHVTNSIYNHLYLFNSHVEIVKEQE